MCHLYRKQMYHSHRNKEALEKTDVKSFSGVTINTIPFL